MAENFIDIYDEFMARLRPYQPLSIVEAAQRSLNRKFSSRVDELRQIPWQTLLIVKWALQDHTTDGSVRKPVSDNDFHELKQFLYSSSDRIARHSGMPLHLFFRRLVHPQIPFQRQFTLGFMREAALIDALPGNHRLRRQFQDRLHLTPQQFLDLSFVTYTAVIDGRLSVPFAWYEPVRKGVGDTALRTFYDLVSRNFDELRTYCRSLPDQSPHVASEYFETTPFRRYPFFRRAGSLECWHPMVFFRGMEGLVHFVLSEAGADYTQPFSDVFENHIVREVFSVGAAAYREEHLAKFLGRNSKVPDALLGFPQANVFVESKAGLFDESIMTIGTSERLSNDTRFLRKAITQGWAASTGLRQNPAAPEQVRNAPVDYLLIVTNRDLEASRGTRLKDMYPEGKLDYPSDQAAKYLPLERIYLLSVDEFERLISAARLKKISIPDFLAKCVKDDSDPNTAAYFFEMHLTRNNIERGWSPLVVEAMEQAEQRIVPLLSE